MFIYLNILKKIYRKNKIYVKPKRFIGMRQVKEKQSFHLIKGIFDSFCQAESKILVNKTLL